MNIVIASMGKVDKVILHRLRDDLCGSFPGSASIGLDLLLPEYAFNQYKNQYYSRPIVDRIADNLAYSAFQRVLAVIDRDLYVPESEFVFGDATGRAGVISLTRLRPEYYGLAVDPGLFRKRVLTEAAHELGHTYGLFHCANARCVMAYSTDAAHMSAKGPEFCLPCRSLLAG